MFFNTNEPEIEGQKLGLYYIDMIPTINYTLLGAYGPIDQYGIPMVDYDKAFLSKFNFNKKKFGIHYTPVTIQQFALGLHDEILNGQEDRFKMFESQINWLINDLYHVKELNFSVWKHTFDQFSYNIKSPWVSAMAQGQGISVLLRAYQLNPKEIYLQSAIQAGESFFYQLEEGGVASYDNKGDVWLEEYPSFPLSHVLNGFIWSIFGVYDLYKVTTDDKYKKLFEECIKTVKNNIESYNVNGWSRYDLIRSDLSTIEYHLTHIAQLQVLRSILKDNFFDKYLDLWIKSAKSKNLSFFKINQLYNGVMRRLGVSKRVTVDGISFKR